MDQSSWGNLLVIAVVMLLAAFIWDRLRSRERADRRLAKRERVAHSAKIAKPEQPS
jgi:hypothetical protein